MDFRFFESLTQDEAEAYLRSFLTELRNAMPAFLDSACAAGVATDFSLSSISPLFAWISASLNTVPLEPDPEVPEWIRSSPTYAANLFDFDEPSRILILRGGYYLGESFVRAYPRLRWAVGRSNTAEQGQPVVTGFDHGMELAVLLVAENTLAREIAEPSDVPAITAVTSWSNLV
jgi:hypothetical protein